MLKRPALMKLALRLDVGGVGFFFGIEAPEVGAGHTQALNVVSKRSEAGVAPTAKKAANSPAGMTVVNNKAFPDAADCAATGLAFDQLIEVSHGKSVSGVQGASPISFGVSTLGRIVAKARCFLGGTARVALAPAAILVADGNAKDFYGQRAFASAACFNSGSHDSNLLSLIGQRPASVERTARALSF